MYYAYDIFTLNITCTLTSLPYLLPLCSKFYIIIVNGPPHLVLLVEAEGKAEHVVVGVERGLVVEHVVYRHSLPLGPDTELSGVRIRGRTRGLYAFSPLDPMTELSRAGNCGKTRGL
jgi:hypothetical protein